MHIDRDPIEQPFAAAVRQLHAQHPRPLRLARSVTFRVAALTILLALAGMAATNATPSAQTAERTQQMHALLRRIATLEERLVDLQRADRPARMRAPFEVVDRDGRPIVRIEEAGGAKGGGVYVYNRQGHVAATLGPVAGQQGGKVTVLAGDGSPSVSSMFYLPSGSGIILGRGDGETGIELDTSRHEFSILNKDGSAAVSLSATSSGVGRLKLAVEPK